MEGTNASFSPSPIRLRFLLEKYPSSHLSVF